MGLPSFLFFTGVSIRPRFFIPISALSGINVARRDTAMDWYQGPLLLETLDELEFKTFEKRPFLIENDGIPVGGGIVV